MDGNKRKIAELQNEQSANNSNSSGEQQSKKVKTEEANTVVVRKIRKARQQVPKRNRTQEFQREDVGGDYNIWYHRYIGQNRQREKDKEAATTRCHILTDSGWTEGCKEKDPYFCLYFAQGCCDLGENCKYLHRLPTGQDNKRIPISKDCFGREKFATDREDMGGVGSFNRECKTLFIGNLKNIADKNMDEIVTKHFKEWGQLEYVRVFANRCYAFVKYKYRLNAEFAKEAMSNQALDDGEVLGVKWASDDPNPMAQERNAVDQRQQFMEALIEQGVSLKNLSYNYPKDYVPPPTALPGDQQQSELYNQYYQYYANQFAMQQQLEQIKEADEKQKEETGNYDYFHYIHSTLKKNTQLQRMQRDLNKDVEEQRKALKSEVVDPYPLTDAQYQTQQQQEQPQQQESSNQEQ